MYAVMSGVDKVLRGSRDVIWGGHEDLSGDVTSLQQAETRMTCL